MYSPGGWGTNRGETQLLPRLRALFPIRTGLSRNTPPFFHILKSWAFSGLPELYRYTTQSTPMSRIYAEIWKTRENTGSPVP